MKAALLNDEDATVQEMPAELIKKLAFRAVPGKLPQPYYPRGTEFEGPMAVTLVRNGQAAPADAECRQACGMTEGQLEKASRTNAAALAGIRGERDMAMFLAGAINGYAPGTTDAEPKYVPGPNWEAWQAAERAVLSQDAETL